MSGDPVDWDTLLSRLLHETQLHIIEAMRWVEKPLSASQLARIFDEPESLPSISYHVRRLKTLRVIRSSGAKPARGSQERFYRLAVAPDGG